MVDDTLKRNVEFQGKVGLVPKITRTAKCHCCKWCKSLAGTYEYPDVPKEVYICHESCRCRVQYDPGGSKSRQDVYTKQQTVSKEDAKIESRKLVGLKVAGIQIRKINSRDSSGTGTLLTTYSTYSKTAAKLKGKKE